MLGQPEKMHVVATHEPLVPVAVYPLFVAQVVGLVFFQKLGLPMGAGKVLGAPLLFMLGALAVRYLRYRELEVDPRRVFTYTMFCVTAVLSQALSSHAFALPAMFLLFLLYLPFIVRIEVSRKTFLRCMNVFQRTMMAVAFIVFVQLVMQRLWGWQSWPNMSKLLPEPILVANFNYYREMGFKAGLFQPNAFFFLEPSFVSQFLAVALVMEIVFFERFLWIGVLTAALFLTFAGTGLLVLAACAPFLLARTSPRALVVVIICGILIAAVGGSLGWFDQFIGRLDELNQPGTSGHARFTVPFQNLVNSVRDLDSTLFGQGAGNNVEYVGAIVLDMAVTKLMTEYGLPTTIAFFVCFSYGLFESAPNRVVAWALFVCFNFCGAALALPVYVILIVTLGTLLRIKRDPSPGAGQRVEHEPGVAPAPRSGGLVHQPSHLRSRAGERASTGGWQAAR
jgi:hypothetical protein